MATDPDDSTRARKVDALLSAALTEFGRAGPEGARVDAIAAAAGMNKRLLYHYVGDKEALFVACLDLARTRILSEPLKTWPDEWRLVCHAQAAGREIELGELVRQGRTVPDAAGRISLAVLTSLLPDLAAELQISGVAAQPKPRLKLRPSLSSAGSGGSGSGGGPE